jgi:hypothetical protein
MAILMAEKSPKSELYEWLGGTNLIEKIARDACRKPAIVERLIRMPQRILDSLYSMEEDILRVDPSPGLPDSIPLPLVCTVVGTMGAPVLRLKLSGEARSSTGMLGATFRYRSPMVRQDRDVSCVFILFEFFMRMLPPFDANRPLNYSVGEHLIITEKLVSLRRGSSTWGFLKVQPDSSFQTVALCVHFNGQNQHGYRLHIVHDLHPQGPFTPIASD